MARTTATFSVSLPPEIAARLEKVRKDEHRTRSELVREALRPYIGSAELRNIQERISQLPEEEATEEEQSAIAEGHRALREGQPPSFAELSRALHATRQSPRSKKP